MAAKAGIDRMARLGFGAVDPHAGMSAIGSILANLHSAATPSLLGSVFFWDRSRFLQHFISPTWHGVNLKIQMRSGIGDSTSL